MKNNKCSLKVFKDGHRLHGTAAILHMTSREGGFDKWIKDHSEKVAKEAAEATIRELYKSQQKPSLKVV